MDIFETFQKEDASFVCIAAPMVRYSKLPFRLLVRELGADVAYTSMIMADSFVRSSKARDVEFTTCTADRPLIVQLASKDACELSVATEMLAPYCDGIDLNCGCPQKWAIQSGIGSALLRRPEKIAALIHSARTVLPRWRTGTNRPTFWTPANQSHPPDPSLVLTRGQEPFSISVKLRVVPEGSRACGDPATNQISHTVELIRRLAHMGVDWVTLHARTPEQRSREPACWNVVSQVVDAHIRHNSVGTHLPIVLNGDVSNFTDVQRAQQQTGCHGVMVARGLLSNPRLFSTDSNFTTVTNLRSLLDRWLYLSARYAGGNCFKNIHQQAYWMMEHHLDRERRLLMHSLCSFAGLCDWLEAYWTEVC
ncbi:hypothetical protein EG68_07345 [Paragonimus skrjabini miyazakii]|uniref:tRNA-dihydrouridine synthase n=1 Tax=Paragonimus skrjabini miyazakii TaxID=59628 RepID=A0A8S9YDV7_9TREM|nr:hypothetical protein EG68_07345 [Paragonimus skrjabini miyazakii]